MRDKDRRADLKATLLATLGGGGLGYGAVAYDGSPIARAIARRQAENILPVYAGMAAGGRMGTGELMMASNMAEQLRNAGFNAKIFNPEQINILNAELKNGDALANFFKGRPDLRLRELALYGVSNDPSIPNATISALKGKSIPELEALVKDTSNPLSDVLSKVVTAPGGKFTKSDIVNLRKFKRMVDGGKFDGIPPGILRDHLMLKRDAILSGKLKIGNPLELRSELAKAKQFFTGEGDMFYSGLPVEHRMFGEPTVALNGWLSVKDPYPFATLGPDGKPLIKADIARGSSFAKNPELLRFRDSLGESGAPFVDVGGGRGPRSLGEALGFRANYKREIMSRDLSEELIPFSKVDNSFINRTGFGSKLRFKMDNKALRRFAESTSGLSEGALKGKKTIFITSGGGGQHIADKLRLVAEAVKGRNDVHIVVQTGSGNATVGINELVKELNKGRDIPLVTAFNRAPQKLFQRFSRGADLNISYGGSSTLTEALANRNPTLLMHESSMNRPNLEWAVSRFGDKSKFRLADAIDTDAYFVRKWGENERKRLGQSFNEFWNGTAWRPKAKGGVNDVIIPGGRNNLGEIVDKARRMVAPKQFEKGVTQKINYMLDNGSKIMAERGKGVPQFLKLMSRRNRQVTDTAKFLQGGLKIPGKYKAIGAAVGALGLGGAAFGATKYLGGGKKGVVPPTPVPVPVPEPENNGPSAFSKYAPIAAGGAALAGLAAYLHHRRKKRQKEKESRGF